MDTEKLKELLAARDAEEEGSLAWHERNWSLGHAAIAALPSLLAELEAARNALAPFAALLQPHLDRDKYQQLRPDDQPVFGINSATIKLGDLRRAHTAMEAQP